MGDASAFDRTPGLLSLGGREFVILRPTTQDMIATTERMTELAREQCLTPLDWVLKYHGHLPGAALALAVREAIALGSGSGEAPKGEPATGGREPSPEFVWKQYATLAGVRWRVWRHVSRALPAFTLKDAEALVTADNVADVMETLDAALKLASIDPEKKTPVTGTPS